MSIQFPIPPQGNFTYRFSTGSEYGFYWYHSHFRAYYNDAIRGPLLIHPSPARIRSFESLARDSKELDAMRQAERAAIPLLLADWYHRSSDIIYDEYFTTGAFPQCVDSLLANGYGRIQCLPESVLQAGPGLGLESIIANDQHDPVSISGILTDTTSGGDMPMETVSFSSMSMDSGSMDMSMSMHKRSSSAIMTTVDPIAPDMSMPSAISTSMSSANTMSGMADMTNLGPKGCSMQMMFKPGFNTSSLPAEICSNTTSELFMFSVEASQGWAALHLVNAAAVSRLSVSLDAHSMIVYAADGLYVEPKEVKVSFHQ